MILPESQRQKDEFEKRRRELLDECKLAPEVFDDVMPRLERFMVPFVECFVRSEQVTHTQTFVQGLLSDLDNKNVESIAYRFGEKRMPLQWFVGVSDWDHEPLRDELVQQVGQALGDDDGVLVFDPSGFPKSGRQSVGVARQWCGRLGKVDNCQVAIYMGYVSRHEHTLVDTRLYLPREWTTDKKRCQKAGVPKGTRYRTRHQLCLEMLKAHGSVLPHSWIAGDDEMGRPYWFRRRLDRLHERYLLAVPSNTLIRDLEADPPPYSGRGRYPKRPWTRVDEWRSGREQEEWTEIDVRDGAKGPLIVEILKRRVVARTDKRQEGHEEVLVIIRFRDRENAKVHQTDYYLSNAASDTPLAEFARAAKAEHRIEECIQRAKSEAGLADYEVRNWKGWHHHQILSLIATWFLVVEARRGKKMDPGDYGSPSPRRHCVDPASRVQMRYQIPNRRRRREASQAQRARGPLSLEAA
jgi:SRSO17 transposase